ncbi:Gfo/Idh/MocA family protein [Aeoliella mucimassa]|uniref:Inositol 2-dehydrogenase/D-chiro-inositol 3-dehydrogenase n=1 Tax=Aeoliella mucimassa TaxID=2527972 RepID=A0A518AP53_9BACT|nr:Gfo/Idh/MocA family oxidoreductase [Aeoliella mucimassa]QDU56481.1 Inositol 2-dehydrogenase/D-chiro-inositol 3-dehydrogenase [Aeoliella mucimassa]
MKLRLGLIGMGNSWTSRHLPALRALGDRFEVRAVCDPVAHRAQQLAHEFRARSADGFREVAFAQDIDAVLLLSARWFGSLPILAACEAGKAVYCGASLDISADEAATLRNTVREAGIAFMAEFPCRLAPATVRLQELMATKLGPPRLLFCNQRNTAEDPCSNQQNGNNGCASTLHMRQTIEMVDWCRYLVGAEPKTVTGLTHSAETLGSPDDYLLMVLDFEKPQGATSSPQAQIACGSYVRQKWAEATAFRRPADLQVVCERGIAFVDLPSSLVWFDSAGQHMESLESERPVGEQLLLHFHRQVASLLLKTASLEDAYRAMTIVLAAQQSHREGRRIECR